MIEIVAAFLWGMVFWNYIEHQFLNDHDLYRVWRTNLERRMG